MAALLQPTPWGRRAVGAVRARPGSGKKVHWTASLPQSLVGAMPSGWHDLQRHAGPWVFLRPDCQRSLEGLARTSRAWMKKRCSQAAGDAPDAETLPGEDVRNRGPGSGGRRRTSRWGTGRTIEAAASSCVSFRTSGTAGADSVAATTPPMDRMSADAKRGSIACKRC